MIEKETRKRTDNTWPLNLMPTEFATMGKTRVEDFILVQSELFKELQQSNKQWLDRVQSEATLASEFATTLASARSIPDAMIACQQWSNRRLEMAAEDSKRLFADAQRFMKTGARLLSNGWGSNGKGRGISS